MEEKIETTVILEGKYVEGYRATRDDPGIPQHIEDFKIILDNIDITFNIPDDLREELYAKYLDRMRDYNEG